MKNWRWMTASCLLVAALLATGCAAKTSPSKEEVPPGYSSVGIVGGSIGGSATVAAIVYAKILTQYYPEISWSSRSGSASVSMAQVTKGEVKLAIAMPSNYIDAYGFEKAAQSRLRSIAINQALLNYVFLIPDDKPWKDITEVPRGANLSPGPPGTTTTVGCEAWLQAAGLSKKDFNWLPLGQSEMADAWRTGRVDIAFTTIGGPNPALLDMASSPRKPKLMGMTTAQLARARSEGLFERLGFPVLETSNLVELVPEVFRYDVLCPKNPQFLNARDDFPEGIAYRMAKIFDEHRQELVQVYRPMQYGTAQNHVRYAKTPLDIHPGVARYYREKGYLK